MLVRDIMQRNVLTVGPQDSVTAAWHLMEEAEIHHLPVVSGNRLVGLVSDRDLRLALPSPAQLADAAEQVELHERLEALRVRDFMSTSVVTVTPDTPIARAAYLVSTKGVTCLAVIDGGALVGVVTTSDLARTLAEVLEDWAAGSWIQLTLADQEGAFDALTDCLAQFGLELGGITKTRIDGRKALVIRASGGAVDELIRHLRRAGVHCFRG